MTVTDKIEEGCTAIVLLGNHPKTADNAGKIVKVGRFLEDSDLPYFFEEENHWEVDKPIVLDDGEIVYFIGENRLKRIHTKTKDKNEH